MKKEEEDIYQATLQLVDSEAGMCKQGFFLFF